MSIRVTEEGDFITDVFERICIFVSCTTYTNVCGHSFKLVDLAISATLVADRCIRLSTPPCNLHRQTLAVEGLTEDLCDFHHRMPPLQQVSS